MFVLFWFFYLRYVIMGNLIQRILYDNHPRLPPEDILCHNDKTYIAVPPPSELVIVVTCHSAYHESDGESLVHVPVKTAESDNTPVDG
jgi:hypothetical protein